MTDRARPSRVLTIVAVAGVAAVALAACSSSAGAGASPKSPSSSRPTAGGGARTGNGFGGGFGSRAAAQGEIAQISGKTLQVQNSTTQTAVTYAPTTRFTITRAATLSAVEVGSCVFATSASSSGNATALTATSVRITPARSGSCVGNGTPRADRTGAPGGGAAPSNLPTNRPSGAPSRLRGAPGGFGGVAGKVTAVSGSTIKVTTLRRAANASPTTGSAVISVTAATKYTQTSATTSTAAKVGLCAVVQGTTDSRGAVAASGIELSDKVNGSCTATTAFPRGRFGGPVGASGANGAGNGNS